MQQVQSAAGPKLKAKFKGNGIRFEGWFGCLPLTDLGIGVTCLTEGDFNEQYYTVRLPKKLQSQLQSV